METINPEKLLLKVAPILDELKINYYITGGFAVSGWGRIRSTLDIDIVIKLLEPKIEPLSGALRKISKFGYIDEEAAKEALRRKGEFNFIDPETGFKVDFWITKGDERAKIEFKRRIVKKIDGQKIYFISPEDLILSKLVWYEKSGESSKHIEDVGSVFKISGEKLDIGYLKKQAGKIGVAGLLKKFLK
ncbi:MAG: hypothetical protein AAB338_01780 [Patescibacteria group bacterium]